MSESDACEVTCPCDEVAIDRQDAAHFWQERRRELVLEMLAKRQELRRERCTCEMTEVPELALFRCQRSGIVAGLDRCCGP